MRERFRSYAAILAVLLIAVSLALSGWALNSRFQEGNQNRNAQSEAIRTVLCYFESLIPPASPQYAQAVRLYGHALGLIHAKPCAPTKGPT